MLKSRSLFTTLFAIGSLVLFSAPVFACGDEEGEEDPEDPTVLSLNAQADTLCGDEEGEEDPEDPTIISPVQADEQCGDEEGEEDPEDPTVVL